MRSSALLQPLFHFYPARHFPQPQAGVCCQPNIDTFGRSTHRFTSPSGQASASAHIAATHHAIAPLPPLPRPFPFRFSSTSITSPQLLHFRLISISISRTAPGVGQAAALMRGRGVVCGVLIMRVVAFAPPTVCRLSTTRANVIYLFIYPVAGYNNNY